MENILANIKRLSVILAASSSDLRNRIIFNLINNLKIEKDRVFIENRKDIDNANLKGLDNVIIKRLIFDQSKLNDIVKSLEMLLLLDDPLNKVLDKTLLDEGLILTKISVPIGVIGVIFESRPDALIQIGSLCIKSGNCAILKGGSEAHYSNKVLFDLMKKSIVQADSSLADILYLADSREQVKSLLEYEKFIDLIIPRGSNEFVRYIKNNTNIAVLGHADGICHTYIDKYADLNKAVRIVVDAKTQYPAACNAMETLLVEKSISDKFIKAVYKPLTDKGVKLKGDKRTLKIIPYIEEAFEEDWGKEYLDLILSIKIVDDIDEAIVHINHYGSGHSDAIVTESQEMQDRFSVLVDSSSVMINCSTRFADGYRYGFGAEVGISTTKIHARGPVGLDGLVIYKYILRGDSHIVEDYSGNNPKSYIHKKL